MIKFMQDMGDGKKLLGLGLSKENVKRLMHDKPIFIDSPELEKLTGWKGCITIIYGETEGSIEELIKGSISSDETNIDETVLSDVERVKEYAKINIISHAMLRLMAARELPPVGDNANFILYVNDLRIVFSIEEQVSSQYFNHISFSQRNRRLPSFSAVKKILPLFDMNPNFNSDNSYIYHEQETGALSIIQAIENDTSIIR